MIDLEVFHNLQVTISASKLKVLIWLYKTCNVFFKEKLNVKSTHILG